MDLNWLHPHVQARPSGDKGWGSYALRPIPAGTTVAAFGGAVTTRDVFDTLPDDRRSRSIQIDEDLFLVTSETPEPGDMVNHSCEPSCGLMGTNLVVAMRDLEPGDEVSFDYAMCDGSDYDEFACQCDAADLPRPGHRRRLAEAGSPAALRGLVLVLPRAADRGLRPGLRRPRGTGRSRAPAARRRRRRSASTPLGSARRRISSNWARAAICWANSAVWIPWKSPSSQPTSWAWAMRSSASLGAASSPNGSDSRSSSSTSSGARPSSSSAIERAWISASRRREASSSGEERTSSSSCLIIEPIRITLAGCSIRSVIGRSPGSSSSGRAVAVGAVHAPRPARRSGGRPARAR